MSTNIAAEMEKEFGQIRFHSPMILFGFNTVQFRHRLPLFEKIFLAIGLICMAFIFIFFKFPIFYFLIAGIIVLASVIYEYHELLDTVEIDFVSAEIRLTNRIGFIKPARQFFNHSTTIRFDEISHFETNEGKFFFFKKRKTSLLVKSVDQSPLIIAYFDLENDARRMRELLQFHIVGKPKLNE